MNYRWDDMLFYGVPGLMHISVGNRLSVSGQDITPDFTDLGSWLGSQAGPTFGEYPKLAAAWYKYMSQRGGPGAAGVGNIAGTVIGQQLSRMLTGGAPLPFTGAAGGLIGAGLATRNADNPFFKFLTHSKEGRTAMLSLIPSQLRNMQRAVDLFSTGAVHNLNGEPEYISAENRTEELTALLSGVTSIRREEYMAVNAFQNSQTAKINNERETMVREIADAIKNGDTEEAQNIRIKSIDMGISISESDIQNRLQDLTQEDMATLQKRQNIITRYTQP